jgi:hypothetical protein
MDIGSWIQSWLNVTTRPGEPAFEEERAKPQADLSTAAIWIGLAALISGILSWIGASLFAAQFRAMGGLQGVLGQAGLPPDVLAQLPPGIPFMTPAVGVGGLIWAILSAIIGYLIFVGLLHLVARLLGGTGNFGKYAYLIAAFHAPITVVNALLGLVPFVGGCVGMLLTIYEIVLAYFATRVEHKLPQGKAIIVVLFPVILGLLVACCAAFTAGSILAGILSSNR